MNFTKVVLLSAFLLVLSYALTIVWAHGEEGTVERSPSVHEIVGRDLRKRGQRNHRPVILVPGQGGSQLWAKLTRKKSSPHRFCARNTKDYYSIWISLLAYVPYAIDCTVDNLRLHYNAQNHTTSDTQGVDVQVLNFGHPKSVEWLDPYFDRTNFKALAKERRKRESGVTGAVTRRLQTRYQGLLRNMEAAAASRLLGDTSQKVEWKTEGERRLLKEGGWVEPALRFGLFSDLAYFSDMAKALVSKGYTRGKDLMAAPFDFRKAPNEMKDFFNKTKRLIEETYAKNGNSRVVVVAHSMGNPVMLYFYNHVVSQKWKDRYIQSHVALAAPWGGAVKSLRLMCTGDSLGLKYVKATTIRKVERTMPSVAWLLPSPSLWKEGEVLVSTPTRNYTITQYQQLFRDLGHDDGYRMWLDTRHLNADLKFPRVEMHCLYGKNVKTPGKLVYTGKRFPDHKPQVVMDDGDGTVNIRSLEAFKPWEDQQKTSPWPVRSLPLPQVDHLAILKNPRVIQYILEVATK